MTTSVYDPNQGVVLSATFTVGGTLTNPSSVTLTVRAPDGTESTPTPVNDSTGKYHANVTPTEAPGSYVYLWEGTGTDQATIPGSFFVRRQEA